jgi:Family of unknown function (DUF6491)
MSMFRTPLVGLGMAVVVWWGGVSPGTADDPKAERVCVNRREVNTIRALDDQHALVKLSAGRHYMFTVDKGCQDLHLARKVAISDGTGRVCADGMTLLSFELPGTGPMRCRIDGIDPVESEDAARELIRSRQ